jgi:integrase
VATSVKERPATVDDAIAEAQAWAGGEAEREMSAEELGIVADELETVTPAAARLALHLGLRTAQRRKTVVSALKASFRPDPEFGMVWWIHPGLLKVGRDTDRPVRRHPHVLPLTPPVQKIVETALALSRPDNPFLFPQLRLRRAGDPGTQHMSERLLNEVLAELQLPGRRLHSSQPFSTHAFRAWFTTHMSQAGFSESQQKLVLDHAEGRTNDVTQKHYNLDLKLPEKFAMLSLWDALIDGDVASYERILASLRNDANLLGQMRRVRSPFERPPSFSADTAGAVGEPADLKRRRRLAAART